jgi:sugar phosphate isomerase/epimerase
MKLSISNIAWEKKDNEKVYKLLKKYWFQWIEIAPTKVVEDIENYNDSEIEKFNIQINNYWLKTVAMQSLIYWKPDLKLFSTPEELICYLEKVIQIWSKVWAKSLIFWSPKNRIFENITKEEAIEKAKLFFQKIWDIAKIYNLNICIEANPEIYWWNFMCNTEETLDLVKKINHENIKLHLDLWTIIANNEDPIIIKKSIPFITHFHISEPYLNLIKDRELHYLAVKMLNNYKWYCSIEMKNTSLDNIEKILILVSKIYKDNA